MSTESDNFGNSQDSCSIIWLNWAYQPEKQLLSVLRLFLAHNHLFFSALSVNSLCLSQLSPLCRQKILGHLSD
ncbi:hypothetical protein [Microcystis aeruginosa]|uniref:hypothetical protein n=1 Tax=Microcystis aeruginosa TaxID=1126 RepID=UPI00123099C5|nr:hypothetical protein [Microcystis aeruginosa]